MNLSETIIPKSDQLNYEDFITGPKTIKVTAISKGSTEQPCVIRYEGDNGHPYKPSKTQRRILVTCWGDDGAAYIGRRMTLTGDPTIVFGGKAVGGIRITHLSDIAETRAILLTVTRGQKKLFHVEPLPAVKIAATPPPTPPPRPIAELIAAGEAIAAQGTESLKAWWSGNALTVPEKRLVQDKLEGWKAIAQNVTS